MPTYWTKMRLEDNGKIRFKIRCADDGDDTYERILRYRGFIQASRTLLERLASPEVLDKLHEGSALASAMQRESGLLDRAREELDKAGMP